MGVEWERTGLRAGIRLGKEEESYLGVEPESETQVACAGTNTTLHKHQPLSPSFIHSFFEQHTLYIIKQLYILALI